MYICKVDSIMCNVVKHVHVLHSEQFHKWNLAVEPLIIMCILVEDIHMTDNHFVSN